MNGKPVLNSVNGSRLSLEQILPIARRYGACLIGMTLDDKGIPDRAEDRLALAEKILEACLNYGLKKADLIIDCIAESKSAKPEAASETLKAVRLIKKHLGLKTILGISNISYGMKNRSSLNAEFMALALDAGLDLAIVDPLDRAVANLIKTKNAR